MSRYIHCRECGENYKLHREDEAMGWQMRKRFISCKTPDGHGLTMNGVFMPLGDIHCDSCNDVLTGDVVVASTTWRESDIEPRDWEPEYGTVLTADAVKLLDALKGESE